MMATVKYLFLLGFALIMGSSHAWELNSGSDIKQFLSLAKNTYPEEFREGEEKLRNLAQMCRHANNILHPSSLMKTNDPTPMLTEREVKTKHQALMRERQLKTLSEHLLKKTKQLKKEFLNSFPQETCVHSLFSSFNPNLLFMNKVRSEMQSLELLILDRDFRGCANYIESRLDG